MPDQKEPEKSVTDKATEFAKANPTLTGAAAGAVVGSVVPVVGTIAGTLVGAFIGHLAGKDGK